MKLKDGVNLEGVQWQMFYAAIVTKQVYWEFGFNELTITSANDGKHMAKSKHYDGLALDFRIWHIAMPSVHMMADTLRSRLGPDYDVVVEVDHIHVEYDPKGKKV